MIVVGLSELSLLGVEVCRDGDSMAWGAGMAPQADWIKSKVDDASRSRKGGMGKDFVQEHT